MKKFVILLAIVMIAGHSYGQTQDNLKTKIPDSIEKVTTNYKKELITKKNKDDKSKIDTLLFNPKMLNILLADEIGSYYADASNLSLQKFSATLDVQKKAFDFGYNLDFRGGDKTKKLGSLAYLGFSVGADEGFATFGEKGSFKNNQLTIKAKFTQVLGGSIFYPSDDSKFNKLITNKRDSLLKASNKTIKKYLEGDFKEKYDLIEDTYVYKNSKEETVDKELEEFAREKYLEYYVDIAEDEIEFLKENDLYSAFSSKWLSFDIDFPIFKKEYTITDTIINSNGSSVEYKPFKLKTTFTYFKKYKNGISFLISPQLEVFNNNTIEADKTETNKFFDAVETTGDDFAVNKETEMYVLNKEFEKFITTAFRLEGSTYLIKKTFGLSAAIEKNFGENYDPINWKLGIPISLKDKEGKPTVNLEIQWKEVNKKHLVGLRVSYVFGKYIN